MTGSWNTFIQVNIYGRTLKDLQQDGIILKSVLNDIGCPKTWIVEGSMYGGNTPICSEDQIIPPVPVLRTTMASVRIPRSSTPKSSRTDHLARFPLEFPANLSEIDSESEIEDLSCFSDDEQQFPIESSSCKLLSPVKEVVDDLILRVTQAVKKRKTQVSIGRSKSIALPNATLRKSLRKRSSAPVMKLIPSREKEAKYSPFGLSTVFSDPDFNRGSMEKAVPVLLESKCTQRIYSDLEPINFVDNFESLVHYEDPVDDIVFEPQEANSFDQYDVDFDDECHSMNDDETMRISMMESMEMHTPPPPNLQPSSSILKKNTAMGSARVAKIVSFKVPRNKKNAENYSRLNKMHQIKCTYENCSRVLNWKLKYGKLRLLNHALTHTKAKCLSCRHCEFACTTVRQMRYHYETRHSDIKMTGFRMLEVFSMPKDALDIGTVWKTCYAEQLNIVGHASTKNCKRRVKKKLDDVENTDGEVIEEPAASNPEDGGGNNFF